MGDHIQVMFVLIVVLPSKCCCGDFSYNFIDLNHAYLIDLHQKPEQCKLMDSMALVRKSMKMRVQGKIDNIFVL